MYLLLKTIKLFVKMISSVAEIQQITFAKIMWLERLMKPDLHTKDGKIIISSIVLHGLMFWPLERYSITLLSLLNQ